MQTQTEKQKAARCKSPLDPTCMSSLKHWGEPPPRSAGFDMHQEVTVDCGWGRLIFGQTFADPQNLAAVICEEQPGRRDVALYMRDPHVVMSYAPQDLFLDPSLTYRLDFSKYRGAALDITGLNIRLLQSNDDETAINRIYKSWGMVAGYEGFYARAIEADALCVLIAEDRRSGAIVGAVTGVDHHRAFNDPDNGSSLWALAVDQQCRIPRVGEALVRELILSFMENGRGFIDLSVMHTNSEAIALYDKLGFEQVPVYCIKKKNSINEPLFVGPESEEQINVYGKIIIDEARRRGIGVDISDAENGFFQLTFGGRTVACRESLSELTSAVAMSRCDDKTVTRKILKRAGLSVPAQIEVDEQESIKDFLARYGRVVVKPARGEQGEGVFVDLDDFGEIVEACSASRKLCEKVILEEYVKGEDLRIIVIDNKVVAAAVRRPASICGTGTHRVSELIKIQSRRRAAATGGESTIPMDDETIRCIRKEGLELDDILAAGKEIKVRKTANLHTGGTIHDVTAALHPNLGEAAVLGAKALNMPVVGFDFMVPDVGGESYVVIEANERPGLANHEPQPTAERFVDLLFPQTRPSV